MKIIKRIKQGKKVFFDYGQFDEFCVYVGDDYGKREALKDTEYFTFFLSLKEKYQNKIYEDFLKIYSATTKNVTPEVRALIDEIVLTYSKEEEIDVEKYFTVIWGGMIAEENKENAILGKRVKHLGMYQVLIDGLAPEDAANFSKGKPWTELDEEMKTRNI